MNGMGCCKKVRTNAVSNMCDSQLSFRLLLLNVGHGLNVSPRVPHNQPPKFREDGHEEGGYLRMGFWKKVLVWERPMDRTMHLLIVRGAISNSNSCYMNELFDVLAHRDCG
jgi:hypothetical protein